MKAMKLPRFKGLVWLHGWINGRTGTAKCDPGGCIQSGYVQKLLHDYGAYCTEAAIETGQAIHGEGEQAEKLIKRLEQLEYSNDLYGALGNRQLEKQAKEERKEVVASLIRIDHVIQMEEEQFRAILTSTSERVRSVFSAYGKGVLWRHPMMEGAVPTVYSIAEQYQNWPPTNVILRRIREVTHHGTDEIG